MILKSSSGFRSLLLHLEEVQDLNIQWMLQILNTAWEKQIMVTAIIAIYECLLYARYQAGHLTYVLSLFLKQPFTTGIIISALQMHVAQCFTAITKVYNH